MRTVRPLHRSESRAFIDLMCECFHLEHVNDLATHTADPHWVRSTRWGLFLNEELVSILSAAPLQFGWGRAIGIASVATKSSFRGDGMALQLLGEVIAAANASGFEGAVLFANHENLYRRAGFELIDTVISGTLVRVSDSAKPVARSEVRTLYDKWSFSDPSRLRRTASDWSRWRSRWRDCHLSGGGYVAVDCGQVREAVNAAEPLPVEPGVKWYGLNSMSDGFEMSDRCDELLVMARGIPGLPQMFMTDQF